MAINLDQLGSAISGPAYQGLLANFAMNDVRRADYLNNRAFKDTMQGPQAAVAPQQQPAAAPQRPTNANEAYQMHVQRTAQNTAQPGAQSNAAMTAQPGTSGGSSQWLNFMNTQGTGTTGVPGGTMFPTGSPTTTSTAGSVGTTTPGMGLPPMIPIAPVFTPEQQQMQMNSIRAQAEKEGSNEEQRLRQEFSSRGFGGDSPLLQELLSSNRMDSNANSQRQALEFLMSGEVANAEHLLRSMGLNLDSWSAQNEAANRQTSNLLQAISSIGSLFGAIN